MRGIVVASTFMLCLNSQVILAAECSSSDIGAFTSASNAAAKFTVAVSDCIDDTPVTPLASAFQIAPPTVSAGTHAVVRPLVPAPVPAVSPSFPSRSSVSRSSYAWLIDRAGADRNIDPLLIEAMMHVESRARPDAVSHKGARGLMQVMPATARDLGHRGTNADLNDPETSISLGTAYLRRLHGMFGNDLPLVIAAYNAGEGAVKKYGRKIPPYRETQDYVRKVLARYEELRAAARISAGAGDYGSRAR